MPPKKPELDLAIPPVEPLPELRLVNNVAMVRSRKDISPQEVIILDNLHRQLLEIEGEKEQIKYAEAATAELTLFTGNVYGRTVLALEGQIKDSQEADYHSLIKKCDEYLMQSAFQDLMRLRGIGVEYIAKVAAEDLNSQPSPPPAPKGFFARLAYLLTGG